MKEDFQAEKEISIVEILKALLSKIIYLILALILGAAAGGIYGYYSSKDVKVYGTNVEFYVNPSTDGDTATGESIYATYGSYSSNVMKNMVNLLESEIFAEKLIDGWSFEDTSKADIPGLSSYGVSGIPSVAQKYEDTAKTKLSWTYKNWISLISEAVNFSFKADGNIAESFIAVSISLDGTKNNNQGEATARALCEQIKVVVPAFVEENMPTPSNYKATNCTPTKLITDVKLINVSYATTQMTKLALIAGAIALIIAAIIVIAMHLSDKRLRDVEVLPKAFNIPVLGVIPAIDENELKKMKNQGGNE